VSACWRHRALELFPWLLETILSSAVAVEPVGVGLLVYRLLQ